MLINLKISRHTAQMLKLFIPYGISGCSHEGTGVQLGHTRTGLT